MITKASLPPVRVTQADGIHDVPQAVRGMDLEMWQLGPEERGWSVAETRFPEAAIMSGQMAAAYAAAGAARDVFALIKLSDHGQWSINGCSVGLGELAVFGPGAEWNAASSAPCEWGAIHLPAEQLERYAMSVAGSAAVIGSGKTRIIRADNASLSELRRSLTEVLRHASMGCADLPAGGPTRAVQDHIIAKLALCLQKPPEQLRSGHDEVVRRALLYLKEHEDEVVYTSNLSMAIGVSERWLRESFERVYGASPSYLLRVRRLHQARQKLQTGHSVSTAATACGFFDFGRFAMAYRRLFGESPSVTRRRVSQSKSIKRRGRKAEP